MDAIKGTMSEIYNDLSKNPSGNTVAEVGGCSLSYRLKAILLISLSLYAFIFFFFLQIRRLRIEIEKLQWLHQQELSEMKHNLGVNFISQRNRAVFFPLTLYN